MNGCELLDFVLMRRAVGGVTILLRLVRDIVGVACEKMLRRKLSNLETKMSQVSQCKPYYSNDRQSFDIIKTTKKYIENLTKTQPINIYIF